jgi:TrmH family RNA methyltransferase
MLGRPPVQPASFTPHMPSRLPFRSITSRHNPLVTRFREVARGGDATDRAVLIEGGTLVREAADAGWQLLSVAIEQQWLETHTDDPLLRMLDDRVDRVVVSRGVLEALSPARTPSGVVALAQPPRGNRDPFAAPLPLVAILDDVQDPGNVGAVARAAEAAGATGLMVCGRSADPFGWKALRGSMGSAFRLPIVRTATAEDAVANARAASVPVAALTARDGGPLYDADFRGPVALLVGGEGTGLRPALVQSADLRITIPMRPPVESLNVAVAAALALYEAARQRKR